MSKNNKNKKSGNQFPDAFQEAAIPVTVDQEKPSTVQRPEESDASNSAIKLKRRMSIAPTALVNEQESGKAESDSSGVVTVTRGAAGFGGRADKGDTSRIPYRQSADRPSTVDGKKNFGATREIDEVTSEYILPEVDEAPGLKDGSSAEQLYNGRKLYVEERAKKNVTEGPQHILFNNSTDLDISSYVIATSGQVAGTPSASADYPIVGFKGERLSNAMHKGNYILKGLKFKISDGKISDIGFDETKVDAPVDTVTSEESNFNWKIDRNHVVNAMNKLKMKYGDESQADWSPLGYAIEYPYEHNMLLHDIEASTGAIAAIAIRSAVSAMAYQRSIGHKDGNDSAAAAVRMFLEGYAGSLSKGWDIQNPNDVHGYCFNKTAFRNGSAAAMVRLFDGVDKYTKKSHFFTFAGGLGKSVIEGLSNYKPLRVKPEFLKVMDKCHMFSTIDGNYSPLLPVYTTRVMHLMNPLSLNYFLTNWKHPSDLQEEYDEKAKDAKTFKEYLEEYKRYDEHTGIYAVYGYAYNEESNRYATRITHPIVNGIVTWLLEHESKIVKHYGDGDVYIPCGFNFMYPSMFQHLVCAALGDVCEKRTDPLREIISKKMRNSDYIWDDLITLEEGNPLHATQMTLIDKDTPLKVGKLADDVKLRLMWGSNFHVVGADSNNSITYSMPWYISDKTFTPKSSNGYTLSTGFKSDESFAHMNIPSVRRGVNHAFVDMLHDFKPSEIRLALDRYLDIPMFTETKTDESGKFDVITRVRDTSDCSKYVKVGAIKYDNLTSGRVVVRYITDQTAGVFGGINNLHPYSIFTIPKELGWVWDATPDMVPVIDSVTLSDEGVNITYYRNNEITDRPWMGGNAREVRSYRVKNDYFPDIDTEQGAALRQTYYTAYADPDLAAVNDFYTAKTGVVIDASFGDCQSEEHTNIIFVPRSNSISTEVTGVKFISNAQYMWSLLQRFYIPDSPFYGCYDDHTAQIKDDYIRQDPLETTFYFGLCGMLPTDYMSSVRSRLNVFDQQKSNYTEDVFAKTSLLFR